MIEFWLNLNFRTPVILWLQLDDRARAVDLSTWNETKGERELKNSEWTSPRSRIWQAQWTMTAYSPVLLSKSCASFERARRRKWEYAPAAPGGGGGGGSSPWRDDLSVEMSCRCSWACVGWARNGWRCRRCSARSRRNWIRMNSYWPLTSGHRSTVRPVSRSNRSGCTWTRRSRRRWRRAVSGRHSIPRSCSRWSAVVAICTTSWTKWPSPVSWRL